MIKTPMFQAAETRPDLSFTYHRQPNPGEKIMSVYTQKLLTMVWKRRSQAGGRRAVRDLMVLPAHLCRLKPFLGLIVSVLLKVIRIRLRSNSIYEHSFGNLSWIVLVKII